MIRTVVDAGEQPGECGLGSWVEGVLRDEPVIDYPPDYGHFPMRITKVYRDLGGALYVGQNIDVRVTDRATEVLAPLHTGDTVEVCATWDTELYVGKDGYVRKVQGPTDHTVSKPNTPSGPSSGECDEWLTFSTGGASCNRGHSVEYRFDFGDGTTSPWSSSTSVFHKYSSAGTFYVKVQARCATDHSIVSAWSDALSVRIECEEGDTPFIRDWLVLGPFAHSNSREEQAFDEDYIGERSAQPSPGATQAGKTWRTYASPSNYVDFEKALAAQDHVVGYAHVYIESAKSQTVQLRLGSDDAVKAWVNGALVHENYTTRGASEDQDIVSVSLQKGSNRLLLKVLDRTGGWGFYARLTDMQGRTLPDITYSTAIQGSIDLELVSGSVDPREPDIDSTPTLTLNLINHGTEATHAAEYSVYMDFYDNRGGRRDCIPTLLYGDSETFIARQEHSVPIPAIPPGQPISVSVSFDLPRYRADLGPSLIFADRIDIEVRSGEVLETDYSNNQDRISNFYVDLPVSASSVARCVIEGGLSVYFAKLPSYLISAVHFSHTVVVWSDDLAEAANLLIEATLTASEEDGDWTGFAIQLARTVVPITVQLLTDGLIGNPAVAVTKLAAFGGDLIDAALQCGSIALDFTVYIHEIWRLLNYQPGFTVTSFSGGDAADGGCWARLEYENSLSEPVYLFVQYYALSTGTVHHESTYKLFPGSGSVDSGFDCGGATGECGVRWRVYTDPAGESDDLLVESHPGEELACTCGGGAPQTGCIEGTVETTDGLPISSIRVKVTGPVNRSDWTDSSGDYKIDGLPAGSGYTVEIPSPGSEYIEPEPVEGVTVPPNDCVDVDFELERSQSGGGEGRITVEVEDEEGKPIAGVGVRLAGPRNKHGYTGPNGIQIFDGLPAGSGYSVEVDEVPAWCEEVVPESEDVAVKANNNTSVDFTLKGPDKKPDLRIVRVWVNPSTSCPGGDFIAYAEVRNSSNQSINDFDVTFFLSTSKDDTTGKNIGQDTLDALSASTVVAQAGEHLSGAQATGEYWVVAYADALGQVDEDDEDNNIASTRLEVAATCPGITTIQFQASGPVELIVTDPDGRTLDQGALAELGGTYRTVDLDDDNVPDVELTLPEAAIGTYEVSLVPRAGAEVDDAVALQVTAGNNTEVITEPGTTIEDIEDQTYTYESTGELTHAFRASSGLNFVSLGVIPQDGDLDFMNDPAVVSLRHWNAERTTWEDMTALSELEPVEGYYLWANDAFVCPVTGMPLEGAQVLELPGAGWQQIGVPYIVAWGLGAGGSIALEHAGVEKSLADAVAAGWISGTISQWDNKNKRWIKPTIADGLTLDPWTGYWIYTFVDDLTLHFSETPAMGSEYLTTTMGKEPKTDPPGPWVSPTDTVSIISSKLEVESFIAKPNPFSDEVTFAFEGAGIPETFAVTVYNMSGHPVWSKELANVAEIVWDGKNEAGMPLANGPYIYVAMITDGTDTYTGKGKVFIDR